MDATHPTKEDIDQDAQADGANHRASFGVGKHLDRRC